MGSCCDGTDNYDSQRQRKPKQNRPQNEIRYVKYSDPAQTKVPAHYRQSSSVKNPNYIKEIKESPSQKSSNTQTSSSNKPRNPLNRPSTTSNVPAMQSNNQPTPVYQPQKQTFPSSNSFPKHESSFNPQVNTRLPISQFPIDESYRKYVSFSPSRHNVQAIAPIVPKPNNFSPPQNIVSKEIKTSLYDRPTEVNWLNKQPIEQPIQQPLNQKFQNTVRDSQISQSLRYSTIQPQNFSHYGLPNIGNTCYLNSILQMLFEAEELIREICIIAKRKRLIFHQLIANVYQDITNKSSYDKKKNTLLKVLSYIQKKDPEFSQYKQNDALQCFLCIMNLLDQEKTSESSEELLDSYFKIEYQNRCRCTKDGGFIITDHFVKSKQFCGRCKQNISFYIHSTKPYVIIFSNSQMKDLRRQIQLQTKDKKLRYQNKAFVTYQGDKRSGHYIAHRKLENGWIEISDSKVNFIGNSSNIHYYAPMFTLYSLKKR